MIITSIDVSVTILAIQHFFAGMSPAGADLFKLLFGTTAWIGGLTLFMWVRDKNKHRHTAAGQVA